MNAVLRRVTDEPIGHDGWPDDATRLSYPDWIVDILRTDLGHERALGALEAMNLPPSVHERPDGYVQDPASQWVAELVGARPGEHIADLCAAPGGKATWRERSAISAWGGWRLRRGHHGSCYLLKGAGCDRMWPFL